MAKAKALILCGGPGKRLRPITYYFQKTMIPVGLRQRPLLEYVIRLLRYHGIKDMILLVNYKYEQIQNYFSKNQILVAVIPGQKAPRTLLGQNCFWIFPKTILRWV